MRKQEEEKVLLGDIRDNEEAIRKVIAMLAHRAERARKSPADFFTFVMREETTRKSLVLVPHQKVLFDFVMAHEKCVIMLPVGHSKTFCMGALAMWLLGHNPTMRGAIVSATQLQAQKPLAMVRDYIEQSAELKMVFPKLRRSPQVGHSWTQTAITVERPMGIKDHSLVAIGVDGAIAGSRLNFVLVDDILNRENTSTPEQRAKIYEWFDSSVLSRLDPKGSKVIVTNTAWHSKDLVHTLKDIPPDPKTGAIRAWPTLKMSATGEIRIYNTDFGCPGQPGADDLRDAWPTRTGAMVDPEEYHCRLVAHDPDPNNEVPLFPARFPPDALEEIRNRHVPIEFARAYLNEVRNDADSWCKVEWINAAKMKGRGMTLASEYRGSDATFTGVDLAVSQNESADYVAFFTFRVLSTGQRLILDVDIGRFDGPTIVSKIVQKATAYNSVVRVENNACFTPDTLVLTHSGYVRIDEVKVGDLVWTHAGRWRPVTKVLEGTARLLSNVKATGCTPIRTTPNHWFYMRESARIAGGHVRPYGEPQWVSAGLADKPAYVNIAVPKWEYRSADFFGQPVDRDIALFLGLYMAEGHSTKGQVLFTINAEETYLVDLIKRVSSRLCPNACVTTRVYDNTMRVVINSTALASAMKFGTYERKCIPLEWMGWPAEVRESLIRGWLLGDGCLRVNNKKTDYATQYISGTSVSRNWIMCVRATLNELAYTPTLAKVERGTSVIEGRKVNRKQMDTISLNSEDTARFLRTMTDEERCRWGDSPTHSGRASNTSIVHDDLGMWSKVRSTPGECVQYDGRVFNLEVEEDHSYVVEDVVVHNAQDFIRQFAMNAAPVAIRAHTTNRSKAHPEYGVPALFTELQQGAWIVPCGQDGSVHPHVQRWIDECLEYSPSHHTGDALMACYFAREQAKEFGLAWGNQNSPSGTTEGIGTAIMSR